MAERVEFATTDGVMLVGDWYAGPVGAPAALLLHMMPADRSVWREFAGRLNAAGWSALAIDLRGHGESVESERGRLDYRQFDDVGHQASIQDVDAAVHWLESAGAAKTRIALIGASIGANLAIAYAAENSAIPAVVALSPGLDYRGLTTEDKAPRFRVGQGLFLATGTEDERSFICIRSLKTRKPDATFRELAGSAHGTGLLADFPGLAEELIIWLAAAASE